METFKHNCATCAVREACQHTFARHHLAKSHGGVGCNSPTGDERWAAEVMRTVAAVEAAKRAEEIAHGELFKVKADAEPKGRDCWHKYEVRHCGHVYATTAKSEAGAINFVRFKLYGMKPLDQCPPFTAREIADTPMTKADALARIRRMAS